MATMPRAEFRHQAAITGRTVHAGDNRPLAESLVRITGGPASGRQVRSAADGHFGFLDLPDGTYTLTATVPEAGTRYGTQTATVAVARNADGQIPLSEHIFSLPSTRITGTVTDQASGRAISSASVQLVGSNERTFTNSQGQFALTEIEAGSRALKVEANGYLSRTVRLAPLAAAQTLDAKLSLSVSSP